MANTCRGSGPFLPPQEKLHPPDDRAGGGSQTLRSTHPLPTGPVRNMSYSYEGTIDVLYERIKALCTEKPEALDGDAWALLGHGLKVDDIEPSFAQAAFTFAKVRQELRS